MSLDYVCSEYQSANLDTESFLIAQSATGLQQWSSHLA